MERVLLRYGLTAALIAGAGFALWRAGRLHTGAADAHRQLLTLQFDAPIAAYDALSEELGRAATLPGFSAIGRDLREQRATATYWDGRYDQLALKTTVTGEVLERDPRLLLLAANAAYRAAAVSESSPAAVQRLEAILAQYAEVLRHEGWQSDAAYNYEFVARRRDALIRARGAKPKAGAADKTASATPAATLHGRAGAVPPGTDMSEFKIVIPQRSDERREQPEAGRGGPKARKG